MIISYFLAANCYGLLLYGCYLLLLKGRSSHTWNRVYLLAVVFLALILPLIKFELPVLYATKVTQNLSAVTLPEITMYSSGDSQTAPWYRSLSLWQLLYISIAVIFLLRFGYKSISLLLFLGKQQYVKQDGYRLALNTGVGPASFGTSILFPGSQADHYILNHEKAHLYYRHHYDKLLMEVLLCFFFPIVPLFFIRKELALVHEFEADASVGADDGESYVRTLLSEHLGTREYYFLQSFFHHPLKRRIMMLRRNQEGKNNRNAKALVLFCTAVLSGSIVYAQSVKQAQPQEKKSQAQQKTATERNGWKPASEPENQNSGRKVSDKHQYAEVAEPKKQGKIKKEAPKKAVLQTKTEEKTFRAVEEMPRPSVDLMKYLAENIRYPEEAKKKGIQGRVVLQFVIDAEGNVNNVVVQRDIGGGCGQEAERVVKGLPKWTPGMQGGKPVSVYYTLPVSFRMQDTGTKNDDRPTAPNR